MDQRRDKERSRQQADSRNLFFLHSDQSWDQQDHRDRKADGEEDRRQDAVGNVNGKDRLVTWTSRRQRKPKGPPARQLDTPCRPELLTEASENACIFASRKLPTSPD